MPHHHTPANYDQDTVSVTDVERALKGVHYPATKEELADYARRQNADTDVVTRILVLPGVRFESEADVATAFSRSQGQGKHRSMR